MEEKKIIVPDICPQISTIKIVGDSDLILNKMNDVTMRELIGIRKDEVTSLEKANVWEQIVTSIHWLYGKPDIFSEESFKEMLSNNKPCISAYGMQQQLGKAIVRNKIEQYSTCFHANVQVIGEGDNLIPIRFSEHHLDEKLMNTKGRKKSTVLARLNRFSGWSAEFSVRYMERIYGLSSIITIINLAGFGLGIGSGTTSGYGRFHVESVK